MDIFRLVDGLPLMMNYALFAPTITSRPRITGSYPIFPHYGPHLSLLLAYLWFVCFTCPHPAVCTETQEAKHYEYNR